MVGGATCSHRVVIQREMPELGPHLLSGNTRCHKHRGGKVCLDKAFVLIDGQRSWHGTELFYVEPLESRELPVPHPP